MKKIIEWVFYGVITFFVLLGLAGLASIIGAYLAGLL